LDYPRGGYPSRDANSAPYRDLQEGYHVGHRDRGRDHPEMFGNLGAPAGSELTDQVAVYHGSHGVSPVAPGLGDTRVIYRLGEAGEPYNGYQNTQHSSGAQYQGGGQNQYGRDRYNHMEFTSGNQPNILRTSPAVEHSPSGPPPYNSSSLARQDGVHRALSRTNPGPAPST
jgi:hypothetical protein